MKHADRDAIADRDRSERLAVRATRHGIYAPQGGSDIARERGEVTLITDEKITGVGRWCGEQCRCFRRDADTELVVPTQLAGFGVETEHGAVELADGDDTVRDRGAATHR